MTLFCLSVSDFVLINTKGDLDKNMKENLTICFKSLIKIEQGNMNVP